MEQARPFRSRAMSKASPSTPGKSMLVVLGVRGCGGGVYARMGNALEQAALEIVAESADARRSLRRDFCASSAALPRPTMPANVFRAGTEAALVVAAVEELAKRRAGADVERADSFGAVEFCGRK